ncbi:putative regulator of septum formation [Georgenia soli]|uniref:Putative regulator of septum formation n=1 Tax=Georgenia soli TaxID=638953 RepID=A0A2A9EMZ3_9MICO|nr:DUF4190 domain-containing protein [Georgenia soli]PFG40173.1 putative regulator of septum formation [Georgenia soli]
MTSAWGTAPGGPGPGHDQAAPAPRPYGQSFSSWQPHNTPPPRPASTTAGRAVGIAGVAVGVLLGPLGVALGIISYLQARRGNGPAGYGIAAMIVGALSTLMLTLFILAATAASLSTVSPDQRPEGAGSGSQVPIGSMTVGECALEVTGGEPVVTLIDCAEWHQAEVYSQADLGDGPYPGEDAVARASEAVCVDAANELIPPGVDVSDLAVATVVPDAAAWDQGVTYARCVALDVTGRNMAGSLVEGTLHTR